MKTLSGLPQEDSETTDRKFIATLGKGFELLRAFEPGDGFLGNQDIAKRTGFPKSTVSRLTYTLTKLGYLSYSDRLEKYQLGSGVLALGYAFTSNLSILQVAKPLMKELADATGTAIGLADRDRLNMIYLEHYSPSDVTTFRQDVGDKISLTSSAIGRAYLAALPQEERHYFLDHLKNQTKGNWGEIKAGIEQAVSNYQTLGYCQSFGDWNQDVNGIAVPLAMNQRNIYTFNAGGPAYRITPEFLTEQVAPQLKNMVSTIEANLIHY